MGVLGLAQAGAKAHGDLGREARVAHAQRAGDGGQRNHARAERKDKAHVAGGHTHVDDARHHEGDAELERGLGEGAERGENKLPAVGLEVVGDEGEVTHRAPPWGLPWGAVAR